MKIQFSLKFKIFFLLSLIIFMTFLCGLAAIRLSAKRDIMMNHIVTEKTEIYMAAKNLETALSNQKGFLTYFLIDNDIAWLEELGKYTQIFENKLNLIKKIIIIKSQKELIEKIENAYTEYIKIKEQAITNYKHKNMKTISLIHIQQRQMFFEILQLCEELTKSLRQDIFHLKNKMTDKSRFIRKVTIASIICMLFAYILILWFISSRLLRPLDRLTIETAGEKKRKSIDQIQSISDSLKGMKELYDSTATELMKSRESLEQSERMALVGKLAAGVAHTIRNPFTSIKMRLFSLSRSLELSQTNEEDFQVISDEIARIDNIVQNFLDFSRLPKLKKQDCPTSPIIDSVIQLLEHRFKTYDVHTRYIRSEQTCFIHADPDRIKEAIINLMVNSCEAMEKGGEITISENINKNMVEIKIKDTGPGIPPEIMDQVVQPFFTTKDYGSGLGLSIVDKIAAEHNGKIEIFSENGTEITITLPGGEINDDRYPYN